MSSPNPKRKYSRTERAEAINFNSFLYHSANKKVEFLLAAWTRCRAVGDVKLAEKLSRLATKAAEDRSAVLDEFADLVNDHF